MWLINYCIATVHRVAKIVHAFREVETADKKNKKFRLKFLHLLENQMAAMRKELATTLAMHAHLVSKLPGVLSACLHPCLRRRTPFH